MVSLGLALLVWTPGATHHPPCNFFSPGQFPAQSIATACRCQSPVKGTRFAAVRTPDTDAANTSRSQLAKNNCLPGNVSKIRGVLWACRWVHRLDRGVVGSGAGEAAANEMAMGRVIGRSRFFSRAPFSVMQCSASKLGRPSHVLLNATFLTVNPPIRRSLNEVLPVSSGRRQRRQSHSALSGWRAFRQVRR